VADDHSDRGLAALSERALPTGGFSGRPGGQYRPDATAWAVLALADHEPSAEMVARARGRLAADQQSDGRVAIRPEHPDAAWPTYLALLAWQGSSAYREARLRATGFLLGLSGMHWPATADSPVGHDTSIRGWPWITDTHSWVEPTSLAILALEAAGHGTHARVREAVRMLFDRQLPEGGWNYGNTRVFGKNLQPFPDSTGMALTALVGRASRTRVSSSLDYLTAKLARLRTPLSIGWGLLGLDAWGEMPVQGAEWARETLARQEGSNPYDTAHLALLLLAYGAATGHTSPFTRGGSRAI
jgi:hypothetical protein